MNSHRERFVVLSRKSSRLVALLLAGCTPIYAQAQTVSDSPEVRAADIEAQLTDEERAQLTLGYMSIELNGVKPPAGALPGAGIVPGVPRLKVPPLWETDASLGVTWVQGARGNGGTQLPSGTAQGSTWNLELIEAGGRMIGSEAFAKGYNVLLAGGINLMREPRNGRTFEYISEDPLLSGMMGGAAVRGIQSNNIISTVKHFASNPQETGRHFMNVAIDEASLRESDLLAFEIAIEQGNPGSIMCAYNRLNGPLSCGSKFLLTDVLRRDWGYKGFVMSDWGAVEALDFALAGLDQQSGAQLDEGLFFDVPLREAAAKDPAYRKRLSEMARRVLWAIYDNMLDVNLPIIRDVSVEANEQLALEVAHEGIVLLKNNGVLPLAAGARSIAVIGGNADTGTMVGGGSSRVFGDKGPSALIPALRGDQTNYSAFMDPAFNRSVPLDAIRSAAPNANVIYRNGSYPSEAALAASQADLAIVFVTQFQTEGLDVPDLSLPGGQDELVAAVAAANPNTIVVIQSGGPVTMPWKDEVAAILEAWYPGARGAEAIADILFGKINPSGHLPITFPASVDQLPRPELPGAREVEPTFLGAGAPGQTLDADHTIEGSDIGYRWFARQGTKPLFAFGHGLSYTTFSHSGLKVSNDGKGYLTASFTIANTGKLAGAEVGQLYLTGVNGEGRRRLVGFAKRMLKPGESATVSVTIDPRLIAEWEKDGWQIATGEYSFAIGNDSFDLVETQTIKLRGFRLDAAGNRIR